MRMRGPPSPLDSLAQSAMWQIRSAVDRFMHEKYVSQFKPQFHDGFRLLFFRPQDVAMVIEGLEVLTHLYPRGYNRAARFVPTIVESAPLPTQCTPLPEHARPPWHGREGRIHSRSLHGRGSR